MSSFSSRNNTGNGAPGSTVTALLVTYKSRRGSRSLLPSLVYEEIIKHFSPFSGFRDITARKYNKLTCLSVNFQDAQSAQHALEQSEGMRIRGSEVGVFSDDKAKTALWDDNEKLEDTIGKDLPVNPRTILKERMETLNDHRQKTYRQRNFIFLQKRFWALDSRFADFHEHLRQFSRNIQLLEPANREAFPVWDGRAKVLSAVNDIYTGLDVLRGLAFALPKSFMPFSKEFENVHDKLESVDGYAALCHADLGESINWGHVHSVVFYVMPKLQERYRYYKYLCERRARFADDQGSQDANSEDGGNVKDGDATMDGTRLANGEDAKVAGDEEKKKTKKNIGTDHLTPDESPKKKRRLSMSKLERVTK